MTSPVIAIAAGLMLLSCVASLVLFQLQSRAERQRKRVSEVCKLTQPEAGLQFQSALSMVIALGTIVARSGLLSRATVAQLRSTLQTAGLPGTRGLGLFVGCKLVLCCLCPVFGWIAATSFGLPLLWREIVGLACFAGGLLLPDYVVRRRRNSLLQALRKGMPDALDMLVICSEAGLGLESSLTKVAAEIRFAHPVAAKHFAALEHELRLTSDRRAALRSIGEQSGLDSMRRLTTTLTQTLQYGTPLAQALRVLATDMRGEMLVQFEERAARLPVLLTLPMIVFILPTVFVVVGGPAMMSVFTRLHHH